MLDKHVEELSSLQRLHYAANRYALLLIFQGLDAAGKDGAIRHVMSGVNPQGCQVSSFKQPSADELEHDFLWRTTRDLPPRGKIGIFNRSYYEEVLIVKVHPEMLRAEGLSPELREAVILRDLQGLEYGEIQTVLQVPEGTVKSRINRGRIELAKILDAMGLRPN